MACFWFMFIKHVGKYIHLLWMTFAVKEVEPKKGLSDCREGRVEKKQTHVVI